jgi:DNA helicase HerA-like ATPase
MLGLNDVQEGVLQVAFKVADDNGLLLMDLKDLRALLSHVADNAKEISTRYGLVSKTSISAVQRALLTLESEGAEHFFGEPALQLEDLLRPAADGRGPIHILAADKLILRPRIYTSFLLWLLSELFEELPEVGDLEQPKLVFFFDEAHLLFDEAPPELQARVEQVVRLIRSKGVGVYFCSQQPDDVPPDVLGQLGNRIQHALRAFTPRDQKAVRVAAETFVANPALDVAEAITQMGVGEALLSMLGDKGIPQMVRRAWVVPPHSRMGSIDDGERAAVLAASPLRQRYEHTVDRESAYEQLQARAARAAAAPPAPPVSTPPRSEPRPDPGPAPRRASNRQSATEAFTKSMLRTIGSQLGRQLLRGLMGALKR